ncbi:MAG: hypothetical protein EXQ67_01175 [Thermoleophilia bacterium]|nr:hypothetical protein [Thermoleophilia bacterium]
MPRITLLVVLVVVLAACGGGGNTTHETTTNLTVTYWPNGKGKGPQELFNLSCDPTVGNVVDPVAACAALKGLERAALDPTPLSAMCTELYGGPAEATIVGTVDGDLVRARLSRVNGCEIGRWQALSALLPTFQPA